MWLDYISTNNSSVCFQPFCLVANADSIKKEKLFLLHQSKVTGSSVYSTFQLLRYSFSLQTHPLEPECFLKHSLNCWQKILWSSWEGKPRSGKAVFCSAWDIHSISAVLSRNLHVCYWSGTGNCSSPSDWSCIQSDQTSHHGTSTLWVQTWCHQHPWDTFLRALGDFISLFRLSWMICELFHADLKLQSF